MVFQFTVGDVMGDVMAQTNCRRPERALSARFVETVTKPGKYFDGQGLFLRVAQNGAKQWVQRIVIRGKRRELGLGSPPTVSLAIARKAALDNRTQAVMGGDPIADKHALRDALTFAEAVEEYLASKLTEFRNEKHRRQWRSTLDTYAIPLLGPKLASDITVQDVLRVLQPIWETKTETASRLRGRIEKILSWTAVTERRSGDNPARWHGSLSEVLPKPAKMAKVKNQPALAIGDAPRWWADLARREGMAAQALRFLALTAARSGEIRGMTWEEIDFGTPDKTDETPETTSSASPARQAVWTIAASRMKNGRAHRVPLTAEAVALLKNLPMMEGSAYVFFAPRGGMLSDMSISAVMRRIQDAKVKSGEAGYLDPASKRPAVPHGLRSTFRQWTAERGYPRDMAEIALAHFIGSDVERAYQRSDMLDRRRDMMADWGMFLMGGSARASNVLRFA